MTVSSGHLRPRHPVPGQPLKQIVGKVLPPPLVGGKTVELAELPALLHPTTFDVWKILAGCRDEMGETHITVAGIGELLAQRGIRIGARAVQHQLARLRAAGLVEDLGWQVRRVPHRAIGELVSREVFVRRVYGALVEKADLTPAGDLLPPRLCYSVPAKTLLFSRSLAPHGGAREGAGRKKKEVKVPRIVKPRNDSEKNQDFTPSNSRCRPDLETLGGFHPPSNPRGTEDREGSTKAPSPSASGRSGGDATECAALASSLGAAPQTPPEKPRVRYLVDPTPEEVAPVYSTPLGSGDLHPSLTAAAPPREELLPAKEELADPPAEEEEVEGSIVIGDDYLPPNHHKMFSGSRPWGPWLEAGVPDHPSHEELPRVVIPPPPLINRLDDADACRWLLRYYDAACFRWLGQKVSLIAKRRRVRDFEEPMLLRAARAFRDHKIAPVAWASFMISVVWKGLEPKERRGRLFPPLGFVWSESWIRDPKRRRWFYEYRKTFSGGRIIPVPEREEFTDRYAAMIQDLHREAVTYDDREKIRRIVERHFPGDLFRDLIARAWQESKAVHAAMVEQVTSGGWVW